MELGQFLIIQTYAKRNLSEFGNVLWRLVTKVCPILQYMDIFSNIYWPGIISLPMWEMGRLILLWKKQLILQLNSYLLMNNVELLIQVGLGIGRWNLSPKGCTCLFPTPLAVVGNVAVISILETSLLCRKRGRGRHNRPDACPNWWSFLSVSLVVQGNPGIHLAFKLHGYDVKSLVNTSAQVSIVLKQRWLTIQMGMPGLNIVRAWIEQLMGGRCWIWDSGKLSIWFTGSHCTFPCGGVRASRNSARHRLFAVINLDQKSCWLMGKQMPLFATNNYMQSWDVIVLPRSEVFITGAVEGTSDGLQGVLEPSAPLVPIATF